MRRRQRGLRKTKPSLLLRWLGERNPVVHLALGAFLGAMIPVVGSLFLSRQNTVMAATLYAFVVAFLVAVARLSERATDFGIYIDCWPSESRFSDGHNVQAHLDESTREYYRIQVPLPDRPTDAEGPLFEAAALLEAICRDALSRKIGQARVEVFPVARDHMAFLLGQQLGPTLSAATVSITGRTDFFSLQRNQAKWGPTALVHPRWRHEPTLPILAIGGTRLHIVSHRRLPQEWQRERCEVGHDKDACCREFVAGQGDGFRPVVVRKEADVEELRIIGETVLSRHGGHRSPMTIRLNCGQAVAFALGLASIPGSHLGVQYYDKDTRTWTGSSLDWQKWWYYLDCDHVADEMDAAIVHGGAPCLVDKSLSLSQEVDRICDYARCHGGMIEFRGGDQVIVVSRWQIDWSSAWKTGGWDWSIGMGLDLATAHAALAIAKRRGRRRIVQLGDGVREPFQESEFT